MSLIRKKKLLMLVVDDELDNLDLLYWVFWWDFNVFKVESGIKVLEILVLEGEVVIIIFD